MGDPVDLTLGPPDTVLDPPHEVAAERLRTALEDAPGQHDFTVDSVTLQNTCELDAVLWPVHAREIRGELLHTVKAQHAARILGIGAIHRAGGAILAAIHCLAHREDEGVVDDLVRGIRSRTVDLDVTERLRGRLT